MKYIVTGAAGNLARQIVSELENRGEEVLALNLPESAPVSCRYEQADITDESRIRSLFRDFRPERVLHMAPLLSGSREAAPARAWEVNATASFAMMELCSELDVNGFFYPSTTATYGGALPDPLPEDYPQWPVTVYGATKVAVERAGVWFAFPVEPQVGISTVYCTDLVSGILRLMDADPSALSHRVYNVHGFRPSANDIGLAIKKEISEFQFRFEPTEWAMSILRATPLLHIDQSARDDWGWGPEYDLERSTADMIERARSS